MDIIEIFRQALLQEKKQVSKITLKNYVSDLRNFESWFGKLANKKLQPEDFTADVIELYRASGGALIRDGKIIGEKVSPRSFNRYLSALRKLSVILVEKELISTNPFNQLLNENLEVKTDLWHIQDFKDYLYTLGASHLTIKNYINDIQNFAKWYEASVLPNLSEPLTQKRNGYYINQEIIDEYKKRLIDIQGAAPRTINRKLSTLRKFIEFATKQGLLDPEEIVMSSVELEKVESEPTISIQELKKVPEGKVAINFSAFPPLRLLQKILILPYLLAEEKIATGIAAILVGKKIIKTLPLSLKQKANINSKVGNFNKKLRIYELLGIKNLKKEFYAPQSVAIAGYPLHKKIYHHIRFTRPNWYKKYSSYTFTHYLHFALLVIFAAGVGISLYQNLITNKNLKPTFASPTSPSRVLSFQGRLTDSEDEPITTATNIRFAIYNSSTATGSALLWQETQFSVTPDEDGVFSIILGTETAIPSSVFSDNASTWLGVTIGSTPELTPRQRIASVAYATNSEQLQGMPPITAGGTSNVILALDSSGNLTIGGSANPTFTASGGQFKLSGQPLLLTTNSSSNGDVQIIPDGTGKIDLQKAMVNNGSLGNLVPGGVEVNDKFGILATESAVAAFIVNNNTSGGDIITASSSGTTRFTIGNDGTITDPLYNANGGIFYANSSGVLAQTAVGSLGQCLQSVGGGTPVWGACTGGSGSNWKLINGTLSPNSDTLDVLIGNSATTSAKFGFLNVNSGTPVASISANNGANATYLTGDGALTTTNRQTLTIGGNTTGDLIIGRASQTTYFPGFANCTLKTTTGGLMNCGADSIGENFWQYNSSTGIVANGNLTTDLLLGSTATSSARFAVLNIAGGTPTASISAQNASGQALVLGADGSIQTTRNNTLTIGGNSTGNIVLSPNNSSGSIQFSNFITNGGLIYTNASGVLAQTGAGTSSQCLLGGATPTFGSCSTQTFYTPFQELTGAIVPNNSTLDFLIGGQSSASAKFALLNVNSGTPVASISANSGANSTTLSGDGILGTTNKQTLSLGNSTTGNIIINSPTDSKTSIGTASTLGTLKIAGNSPGKALVNLQYLGTGQNILVASNSAGTNVFSIDESGNVSVGAAGGGKLTAAIIDPYLVQNQYTSGNTELTFQTMAASNGDFIYKNQSTELSRLTQAGQLQLPITGSTGGLTLGGDTQIFRGAADRVDLASGDSLNLVSGALQIGGTTVIDSSRNGTFQTLNVSGGCTGCTSVTDSPFKVLSGAIVPHNSTVDFLLGSQATTSAKFAVLNVNSGTPVASISANSGNNATYLTGSGNLGTTNGQTLTVGGTTTGNVVIDSGSSAINLLDDASITGNLSLSGTTGVTLTGNGAGITFSGSGNHDLSAGAGTLRLGAVSLNGTVTGGNQNITSIGNISANSSANTITGFGTVGTAGTTNFNGTTLTLTGSTTDITSGTNEDLTITPNGSGNIILTSDSDTGVKIGTSNNVLAPLSVSGGIGSNAGFILDQLNSGDLITASAAGATKFVITNGGSLQIAGGQTIDTLTSGTLGIGTTNATTLTLGRSGQGITLPGFTSNGGLFYANGSGVLAQTGAGTSAQCLLGGTTPTFGSCSTGTSISPFQELSGAIVPNNSTVDFLLGGQATSSAKFGILNINSGTPVASISAQNVSGQALSLNGDGSIQTLRNNTLTLGGDTTGNIILNPQNGTGSVGIGTNNPLSKLHISQANGGGDVALIIQNNAVTTNETATLRFRTTTSTSVDFATIATTRVDSSTGRLDLSSYKNGLVRAISIENGNVSLGTTSPLSTLYVTRPLSFGTNGKALGIFDQIENQDILTASASGITKFVITNGGSLQIAGGQTIDTLTSGTLGIGTTNATTLTLGRSGQGITLPGFTTNGGLFYANGSGVLAQTGAGSTTDCLIGGTTPSFASCAGVSASTIFWNQADGALYPKNSTVDLLVGGQSSASAKFAVLNVNSGTPVASVSAGVNGGSYLTADGTLATTNRQTLTIGNSSTYNTTGNVLINPNGTGNVGIGTTGPNAKLSIKDTGAGYINIGQLSGNSTFSGVAFGQTSAQVTTSNYSLIGEGTHTYLNAPSSGNIYFRINNLDKMKLDSAGNLGIGTTSPTALLDVAGTASISGALKLYGTPTIQSTVNQTLTLGGDTTGNIVLSPLNGSGSIQFSNFSTNGGLLYTNASGTLAQTGAGGATQCLLGGTTPTFGSCATGITPSPFQELSGSIVPNNSTLDFLVGGQATTSAKFAVLNINSGIPVASVSSGLAGTAIYITADGTLSTANRQSLTIGNSSTYNTTGNVLINPNGTGNVGIGTLNPISGLYVTHPLSAGATGKALGIFDQIENQDILTASAGGTTKFIVTNGGSINLAGGQTIDTLTSGTLGIGTTTATTLTLGRSSQGITLPGFTSQNGVLYGTNTTGVLAQATTSTTGQCLLSGASNPAWGVCPGSGLTSATWTLNSANGTLNPINNTLDILVGGTATTSAKFAILGVAGARGAQTASVSGNLVLDAAGSLQTTLNQTLTLGGDTTGNISILPTNDSGLLGIGTSSPISQLHITRTLAAGATGKALGIFDQIENQDILTASAGGTTKFIVTNGGSVNLASGQTIDTLTSGTLGIGTVNATTLTLGRSGQGITLPGFTSQNGVLYGTNTTGVLAQATTASTGLCLLSGASNPSWGACPTSGGSGSNWTLDSVNGILSPNNNTLDILFGGTASSSAKFAFLNNAGQLSPIASISATTASGGSGSGLALGGDGSIQSLRNNTLTVGGNTTGDIQFKPGNVSTPALYLASSGNIGMGTVTPSEALQLYRGTGNYTTFRFDSASTQGYAFAYDGDNSVNIGANSSSVLNLRTSNATRATILANGQFGIGTTSPLGQLHVTRDLSLGVTGKALGIFDQIENQDIFTASASGITKFVIGNDGRIGINTAASPTGVNPLAMLQVYSRLGTTPAASISARTSAPVLQINQDGVGDLIAASSSGITYFRVYANGDIDVGPNATGKLNAGTIDPPYTIDGKGYATYVPSMIGVNEEYAGKAVLSYDPQVGAYTYKLNFNGFEKQSDQWVYNRIIDPDISKVSVLMTPNSSAKTWYKKDGSNRIITLYADRPVEISYRLTAPRFDNEKWKTYTGEVKGLIAPPPTTSGNGNNDNNIAIDPYFATLSISEENGQYVLKDSYNNKINHIDSFSKVITATIESGWTKAKKITTDNISAGSASIGNLTASTLAVSSDTITIGGQNIRDFIISTVENANIILNGQKIISPLASIDQIHTNVISPLGSQEVAIKGNLAIKNDQNLTVAQIDTEGNASFSGELTSKSIQTNDATIAGTLAADNVTTNDATVAGTLRANNISLSNEALAKLGADLHSIASGSGNLADYTSTSITTGNLRADYGIFEQGVVALGPSTFSSLTAIDQISIGGNFVLGENSINTLGADLEIQSLRQGNISFMAGKVKIDTDGNMLVDGNLSVSGNIAAARGIFTDTVSTKALVTNIISPLPDNDLTLKINGDASSSGKLKVADKNGQQVLSVNGSGDLLASGSGQFSKLNFSLVGQALATSDTQATATGSAGYATLKRNKPELTIKNPNVTENSLIYITPFGDTQGKVLYLLRQTPEDPTQSGTEGSFTVGVSGLPSTQDLQFNWLIVN